jgi:hypothetical protein
LSGAASPLEKTQSGSWQAIVKSSALKTTHDVDLSSKPQLSVVLVTANAALEYPLSQIVNAFDSVQIVLVAPEQHFSGLSCNSYVPLRALKSPQYTLAAHASKFFQPTASPIILVDSNRAAPVETKASTGDWLSLLSTHTQHTHTHTYTHKLRQMAPPGLRMSHVTAAPERLNPGNKAVVRIACGLLR